jgi:2-iminobutanoate/2-iminopropanoate deaminase
MHSWHNPPTVAKPPSKHAQAVETKSGLRWLHISGQIGLDKDGKLADSEIGQHRQIWANILNLLAAANMGREHLVRVCCYVTRPDQIANYRITRDEALQGVEVASTAVVIAALAKPEWVVEMEAVAAAP